MGTLCTVRSSRPGIGTIAMTLDTYSHVAPGLQEKAAAQFDNLFKAKTANGRW